MGDPRPLGGGTPSVSAKRSAEQKYRIKIGRTKIGGIKIWWGTLSHWVSGTTSASAERSVEQKMAEQKFGGDPRPLGSRDP